MAVRTLLGCGASGVAAQSHRTYAAHRPEDSLHCWDCIKARERCVDLLGDQGWRWRVLRTSNA
jgi:hypothetical protein